MLLGDPRSILGDLGVRASQNENLQQSFPNCFRLRGLVELRLRLRRQKRAEKPHFFRRLGAKCTETNSCLGSHAPTKVA